MEPKTSRSCLLSAFTLLLFQSLTFAQTGTPNTTPEKATTSVTFPVCKVELADTLLAEIPYAEALRSYALPKRESFFIEEENEKAATPQPVVESWSQKDNLLIEAHFHPFVYGGKLEPKG